MANIQIHHDKKVGYIFLCGIAEIFTAEIQTHHYDELVVLV